MTAPATALITGAGRGLGLEFVRQCLARGDRVVAATRHRSDALAELADAAGDRLLQLTLDVGDEAAIIGARRELEGRVPSLELLINNAGMYSHQSRHWDPDATHLNTVTQSELMDVFRVNAAGPVVMVRHFRDLLERGCGRILNISSRIGAVSEKTGGGDYAYAASKAALNIMTRALAAELAPAGIVAIAITPGWVRTEMGGARAALAPEESVRGMLAVAAGLRAGDTGRFVDYQGEPQPW